MTDTTQHPEALAFCWATELAMTQQPVTLSVTEAREVSAGMQRLHIENAAIQAGYAAARLKIKSLQARIKAMAEEHADELMVAHMDGRMRAAQPAGAQQPGAVYAVYAELPDERAAFEARFPVPGGVSWNGSEYVVKDDYLNSYRCDRFVGQWAAWQARASQPAPATQQAGEVVAYLDIGAGGYLDLGSALSDEDLQQLPKGRHALVIAGTYGIDGYVAAPQPSPTTKPAPQQEAQEPGEIPESIERMATGRYKVVPSHESMFHRWAVVAGSGTQQLYLGSEVECQNMARKFAGAFLDGAFVTMQSTSPNPAPAPLSDDTKRLNWLLWKLPGDALRYVVGELADTSSGSEFRAAIDAALAAQGGKDA